AHRRAGEVPRRAGRGTVQAGALPVLEVRGQGSGIRGQGGPGCESSPGFFVARGRHRLNTSCIALITTRRGRCGRLTSTDTFAVVEPVTATVPNRATRSLPKSM